MKKHVPYKGPTTTRSRWSVDHGVVSHRNRAQMYRAFLQLLRLIPDPHVWKFLQPGFRKMCSWKPPTETIITEEPSNEGTIEEIDARYKEWRARLTAASEAENVRKRQLSDTRKELNELRAAVGCHPHALIRLIELAYGQRGPVAKELLNRIAREAPASERSEQEDKLLGDGRKPLPIPLLPVAPPPRKGNAESTVRAREYLPENHGKRQAILEWRRQWDKVGVPIVLPKGSGYSTGWEDRGIVETIRAFAGVGETVIDGRFSGSGSGGPPRRLTSTRDLPRQGDREVLPGPSTLPTFHNLSPVMQRIFPIKLKPTHREPPYPRPPRHETRETRKIWSHPVPLSSRMVRVIYENIWHGLEWVRPLTRDGQGKWVKCTYDEMRAWESGMDLPRTSPPARTRSGKDPLPPERPHKWSNTTENEEMWYSARKQDRSLVIEEDIWLLNLSNTVRWISRWEQLQVDGRVNRQEYITLFNPLPQELDWLNTWERDYQHRGWGTKGHATEREDLANRTWKKEGGRLFRKTPTGWKEEYRPPGVNLEPRYGDWERRGVARNRDEDTPERGEWYKARGPKDEEGSDRSWSGRRLESEKEEDRGTGGRRVRDDPAHLSSVGWGEQPKGNTYRPRGM